MSNNSITNYKNNFKSISNKASKNPFLTFNTKKHVNNIKSFGKKTHKNISSSLNYTAKKLYFLANGQVASNITYYSIMLLLTLSIGVLVFFYYKLKTQLKTAVYFLIIGLVSLITSMYGVKIILGDSLIGQLLSLILIGVFSITIILFTENMLNYFKSFKIDSPYIIRETKNGKSSLNVPQDTSNSDTIIIYRSDNEDGGIEFSYSFWMIIQDYNYNKEKSEKHIFHKGDPKAETTFCPKVSLKSDTNTMVIRFNLIDNTDSPDINIGNIPISKWFHVSIVVKQKNVEIYFNGRLKNTVILNNIPRQNFSDLWVNLFGGFDGFISKLQYHRRALTFDEVESIVTSGPSTHECSVSGAKPPYLDNSWWLER